jgi:MFS family permease
MMTVGLVWVFTQEFSASVIPWFLAFSAVPHLLLSVHAGRWTSKLGPLRTIVWADILRGAIFILLALSWGSVPQGARLATLFAFSFISNFASALFNPAIMSLPVFLPEKHLLQEITALTDSCFSFGNIIGPLLSALLYPQLGLAGLFLFNGLSYLFAAWLESRITLATPSSEGTDADSSEKPMNIGRLLKSDSLITYLLGGFLAINLFLGPLLAFMPLFVKGNYQGTINTLAWLETSLAIGMALGGAALSVFRLDSRAGIKIVSSMLGVSVSYLCFALTRQAGLGCACLLVLGFFLSLVNIFAINLFQTRPAPRDVPTAMSLVNVISAASMPFSMAAVGLLVETIDVRRLAVCFGCILLVVTFLVASNRELRRQ